MKDESLADGPIPANPVILASTRPASSKSTAMVATPNRILKALFRLRRQFFSGSDEMTSSPSCTHPHVTPHTPCTSTTNLHLPYSDSSATTSACHLSLNEAHEYEAHRSDASSLTSSASSTPPSTPSTSSSMGFSRRESYIARPIMPPDKLTLDSAIAGLHLDYHAQTLPLSDDFARVRVKPSTSSMCSTAFSFNTHTDAEDDEVFTKPLSPPPEHFRRKRGRVLSVCEIDLVAIKPDEAFGPDAPPVQAGEPVAQSVDVEFPEVARSDGEAKAEAEASDIDTCQRVLLPEQEVQGPLSQGATANLGSEMWMGGWSMTFRSAPGILDEVDPFDTAPSRS